MRWPAEIRIGAGDGSSRERGELGHDRCDNVLGGERLTVELGSKACALLNSIYLSTKVTKGCMLKAVTNAGNGVVDGS